VANPRARGCVILLAFLAFAVVCAMLPFVIMPSTGTGVALPVIEVPGEVVAPRAFFGMNLTNTLIGTLLTTLLVLLIVLILWRSSNGWTREVPGRAQAFFETLAQGLYNFSYGIGGERLKRAPLLWPLVATIFLYLLAANYMKLLPGVETVGTMHCAYEGQSGYPMVQGWTSNSYRLWVDAPLSAGTTQTYETYNICNEFWRGYGRYWFEGFPVETPQEIDSNTAVNGQRVAGFEGQADLTAEQQRELHRAEYYVQFAPTRLETAQRYQELQAQVDEAAALVAELEGATVEEVREEAPIESPALEDQILPQPVDEVTTPDQLDEQAEAAEETVQQQLTTYTTAEELESARQTARSLLDTRVEALNLARTQLVYPGAVLPFTEQQIESGAKPFIFHITPFVRGPATDLSFTFALAIIAIVAVQIYGVRTLGPSYFEKFINVSAIGNIGKRPMGVIDFIVGLIEIISEIGKIVSLSFRLFGNLFAGGVTLMAITFLLALFLPGIIFGLELVIGFVQALVFAVLTLVFSVQAMESHHGDDHGHHDDEHHETAAGTH
jgi:F0F1-type ATP synthase membrane subunit a